MARNPVVWFEIYVEDTERAKRFYESVLETKLERLDSPARSSISVATIATEAGRVVNAGGRIQREKLSIGQYGFIALAIDTEGNMFGLHSHS